MRKVAHVIHVILFSPILYVVGLVLALIYAAFGLIVYPIQYVTDFWRDEKK